MIETELAVVILISVAFYSSISHKLIIMTISFAIYTMVILLSLNTSQFISFTTTTTESQIEP